MKCRMDGDDSGVVVHGGDGSFAPLQRKEISESSVPRPLAVDRHEVEARNLSPLIADEVGTTPGVLVNGRWEAPLQRKEISEPSVPRRLAVERQEIEARNLSPLIADEVSDGLGTTPVFSSMDDGSLAPLQRKEISEPSVPRPLAVDRHEVEARNLSLLIADEVSDGLETTPLLSSMDDGSLAPLQRKPPGVFGFVSARCRAPQYRCGRPFAVDRRCSVSHSTRA